jgi:hypothetical protein
VILALDLGTKTGWAAHAGGGFQRAQSGGTQNFAQGKFAGGGQRFLAFETLAERASQLADTPRRKSSSKRCGATSALTPRTSTGGLLAILTKWCEQRGIPYQGVPVGTIKKHATGKGNAKQAGHARRRRRRGASRPKDDNEADAIALLRWRLGAEMHRQPRRCSDDLD